MHIVGLGNISILSPECNITVCNTEYRSYFENTAIPFVQYYYIFCIIANLLVLYGDYRTEYRLENWT